MNKSVLFTLLALAGLALFFFLSFFQKTEIHLSLTESGGQTSAPLVSNGPPEEEAVAPAAAHVSETAATGPEPSTVEEAEETSPEGYPWHTGITATVFWVGEPKGGGSSEDNALSAWDDWWQEHYGCYDDPQNRDGYHPLGCVPRENPFYLDLPFNDYSDDGTRKPHASDVVPWAHEKEWGYRESMMKNRWVEISRNGITCFGQIEDAGPYEYDDYRYVFGQDDERPQNRLANDAGLDVSPALRDCLGFEGVNNDRNKVSWRFIDEARVPEGPWKKIVTTRQVSWSE